MDVPVTLVSRGGVALADGVAGADLFIPGNDGNVLVRAVNSGAAASYVDVVPAATYGGMALSAVRVPLPVGETWLGPWPPAVFNAADGSVELRPDPAGDLSFTALGI